LLLSLIMKETSSTVNLGWHDHRRHPPHRGPQAHNQCSKRAHSHRQRQGDNNQLAQRAPIGANISSLQFEQVIDAESPRISRSKLLLKILQHQWAMSELETGVVLAI
jgi:hypothetical protein